ncbi:hypothetical protein JOC77_003945 [Peribacillus deserti]|uniref:Uncharacterized protein n=1 Tax=Peribacillus deserti TaxID=673318 RepID=A0ABS2QP15_9BACI|nr:hypothetical protein [Peribacillus deserti]
MNKRAKTLVQKKVLDPMMTRVSMMTVGSRIMSLWTG